MEDDVSVSNVRERWAGSWKGDLPCLLSLRVVMQSSCQRWIQGKADGKNKVMGKERKDLWKKWRLIVFSNSATSPQNSGNGTHLLFKISFQTRRAKSPHYLKNSLESSPVIADCPTPSSPAFCVSSSYVNFLLPLYQYAAWTRFVLMEASRNNY
jgi:hypothetical protein